MNKKLSGLVLLGALALLAGCSNKTPEPPHIHLFGEWESVDDTTHKRVCECGETQRVEHDYSKGVTKVGATHMSEGVKVYRCDTCGHEKEESIAKLTDHTFNVQVINDSTLKEAATCGSSAIYYYSCECGEISTTDTFKYGSPAGHTFTQGLTVESGYKTVYGGGEQFDVSSLVVKAFCDSENEYVVFKDSELVFAYQNGDEFNCGDTKFSITVKDNPSLKVDLDVTVDHGYIWEKGATTDSYVCASCGSQIKTFDKTLDSTDAQSIEVMGTNNSISLAGISSYISVKSINLGDYSLGTNISSLDMTSISGAYECHKEDVQHLTVVVTDETGGDHAIDVPVKVVTKYIKVFSDFSVLYNTTNTDVKYGYYEISNDIDAKGQEFLSVNEQWDNRIGFRGVLNGNNHTISNLKLGWKSLFGGTGTGAVAKNIRFTDVTYTCSEAHGLLARVAAAGTFSNIFVNFKSVDVFSGKTLDQAKKSGLLVGRGNTCSFENIEVDARGLTLFNLLGCDAERIVSVNNFNVYCKDYYVFGYTGGLSNITGELTSKEGINVYKDPVLDLDKQFFYMNETSAQGLDVGDQLEGKTVTSMSFVKGGTTYDLGNDTSNLNFPSAVRNDVTKHGEVILNIAFTEGGVEGTASIPMVIATRGIATKDDITNYLVPSEANYTRVDGSWKVIDGYYVVTNDITDANGTATFDWYRGFSGTIDGNGHTITTQQNANGLLSSIYKGTIKDLNIVDRKYTGKQYNALIAKSFEQAKLENVSTSIIGAVSEIATSIEGSNGYICFGKSLDTVYTNCKFDMSGYDVGILLSCAGGTQKNTFSGCTFICKTYKFIWRNSAVTTIFETTADGMSISGSLVG